LKGRRRFSEGVYPTLIGSQGRLRASIPDRSRSAAPQSPVSHSRLRLLTVDTAGVACQASVRFAGNWPKARQSGHGYIPPRRLRAHLRRSRRLMLRSRPNVRSWRRLRLLWAVLVFVQDGGLWPTADRYAWCLNPTPRRMKLARF